MKDKIKLEIERLKVEQKPFDYSAEQVEIKSLEDKIQPLLDRQMKKKPMYDEYQVRIKELEDVLSVLEQFEDVEIEDIPEDGEEELITEEE